jgi:raffinose/stachyose/melibiose transport system substrate-binding protein
MTLSLARAATLAVLLLAACTPRGRQPAPAAARAPLTFWNIYAGNQAHVRIYQHTLERFQRAHPDVPVEMAPMQNDSYKTKLKLAMGAGAPPCVFSTWGGGPLFEYVHGGLVMDLTARLGPSGLRDRYLPAAFSMATTDGKVWGVPMEDSPVALVFYDRTVFARLGLTPPKTWEDLQAVIKKLKAAHLAPFSLANKTKWPGAMYFTVLATRLAGAAAFDAAARGDGGGFKNPAFVKAGALIQELVREGAFAEGFQGLDYDTGQSRMLVYSGKAGMELMGSWTIAIFHEENQPFADKVDFFPFPALGPAQGAHADPAEMVGSIGDQVYSVSTTCPYPEEAFAFLQTLADQDAVDERVKEGYLPPAKGVHMKDPLAQRVADLVATAPRVQLWYDQYLPPEVGETFKDVVQGLFGLTLTPEEAAQKLEDSARAVRDKARSAPRPAVGSAAR